MGLSSLLSGGSRSSIEIERDALARAVGGAMLFGIPLLFTMEMWWIGEHTARWKLLLLLVLAFVVNVALARMSGFRPGHHTLRQDVEQSCESVAVGIVVAATVLVGFGMLDDYSSASAVIGTIAVLTVPLAIGASVGNVVFSPDRAGDGGDGRGSPLQELARDVAATVAGALFIGFALAPTDEIPMIAADMDLRTSLGAIAISLFASYVIVFASGFDRSHHQPHAGGLFQRPFSETMLAYWISLAVTIGLLFVFGHVDSDTPLRSAIAQALVLALPASIGGAAGRVVV